MGTTHLNAMRLATNLNYNRSDESLRIKTKHAFWRVSGKATNTATRCGREIAILRHADLQLNKEALCGRLWG